MAENIREIVLDTLLDLERKGEYSHKLVKAVLDKFSYLEERDRAFYKRVTEGTLERQLELDYYLDCYSKLPVRKMRPLIRCLLRMSVYQLLYMDAVPDSAVCNEACKLAAKRGFQSLKGYVNGILRTIARQRGNLPMPEATKEPVPYLSIKYSMPEWLVELWLKEYGWKITEIILQGLLQIHPVSLRFQSGMSEKEQETYCALMEAQGAKLSPNPYLSGMYLLERTGGEEGIRSLPGFEEGIYTVQDVSSALAVVAAGIQEGDFVVDCCGAPGGKSIFAGELIGSGRVLARDISEEKVALIEENIRRMRAANIETQIYDATDTDEKLTGKADVVLLDVPCSGLGVMGKKRDIKYQISQEKIKELSQLQKKIVKSCAPYVKQGGVLLYSTCTIHRGENQEMVRFMTEELGFIPASLEEILPEKLWERKKEIEEEMRRAGKEPWAGLTEEENAACIQLLPGYMEADGFFIARFRRG